MKRFLAAPVLAAALLSGARAQVIEFESNKLRYQTLTRSGVTIMFTYLPNQISEYAIIQTSIANGSAAPYTIRPEDFTFERADGSSLRAAPAKEVVEVLYRRGTGSDVAKLITTFEASVYGNARMHSTNGYEQRRLSAISTSSGKMRAAATASALALVQTKLTPGQSTDGVVFFLTDRKPLGPGKLVVKTNTDTFEFLPGAGQPPRER